MTKASLCRLAHRSLVSISGRDTFKYLQALTTNNLAKPESQFTAFLNAQGRVLYEAFVYKTAEDECLVELDSQCLPDFRDHLARYKLRSKFQTRTVDPEELGVHAVWNYDIESRLPGNDNTIWQRDPRSPHFGHRVLCSPSAALQMSQDSDMRQITRHMYDYRRYQHGIPEGPSEIFTEKALPMESNLDIMKAIDFHKGCYLGQELTVRTHHTGVIRKRILPVVISAIAGTSTSEETQKNRWFADPEIKSEIVTSDSSSSSARVRPAGRLLGRVDDLGIALCRLNKMNDGSKGQVEIDGRIYSVEANKPAHWPINEQLL